MGSTHGGVRMMRDGMDKLSRRFGCTASTVLRPHRRDLCLHNCISLYIFPQPRIKNKTITAASTSTSTPTFSNPFRAVHRPFVGVALRLAKVGMLPSVGTCCSLWVSEVNHQGVWRCGRMYPGAGSHSGLRGESSWAWRFGTAGCI